MLKISGKVLFTEDEERELPVKDKNGIPTNMTKKHRFTRIQILVKDEDLKHDRAIMCSSIDLPASFVVPKSGETWVTPEVRRYEVSNGSIDVAF